MAITAAAQGAVIRVNESAVVETPRITLGEVAVIEAPPAQRARLAAVVVAYVPRGESGTDVAGETLREALSGVGFNLAELRMTGAVKTAVELKSSLALRAVSTAAARYLAAAAPKARFAVANVKLDFAPPKDFTPVVTAVRPGATAGPVRFDIADAADPSVALGHARARLEKSVPVLVARRALPGGCRISAGDIEIKFLPAESARGALSDAHEAIGRRTLVAVSRGGALSAAGMEEEPAIRRGDKVVLAVTRGKLTVSVNTRAQENGLVGDVVRLKKAHGRGEYLATVTGPARATPLSGGSR